MNGRRRACTRRLAQIDDVAQQPLALALRVREVQRVVEIDVLFVEPAVADGAVGARIAEDVERAERAAADRHVRDSRRSIAPSITTSVSTTSPGRPVSLTSALNACENGSRSVSRLSNPCSFLPVNRLSTRSVRVAHDRQRLRREAQRVLRDVAEVEDERRILRRARTAFVSTQRPELESSPRVRSIPDGLSTVRIDRQRRPVSVFGIVQSNCFVAVYGRPDPSGSSVSHSTVSFGSKPVPANSASGSICSA